MPGPSSRRIVLVSGPPASGKTTLARPLAERLGFALLSKDDIKEAVFTALEGPPGDLALSRKASAVAMDILWTLAHQCPTVVLEANFRTKSDDERHKFAALLAHPGALAVEVYCRLPREEASRRFAERARLQRHHPAHVLAELSPERMAEYEEPFALTPVIEVDTTRPVDLEALSSRIPAEWAR